MGSLQAGQVVLTGQSLEDIPPCASSKLETLAAVLPLHLHILLPSRVVTFPGRFAPTCVCRRERGHSFYSESLPIVLQAIMAKIALACASTCNLRPHSRIRNEMQMSCFSLAPMPTLDATHWPESRSVSAPNCKGFRNGNCEHAGEDCGTQILLHTRSSIY